jgi:hypothetical protein
VKVLIENGSLSNMWIIGGFRLQTEAVTSQSSFNLDNVYPVGSIYLSVNTRDPHLLFGGTWEHVDGNLTLDTQSNLVVNMWKRVE